MTWKMDTMFAQEPVAMVGHLVVNVGWVFYGMRSGAMLNTLLQNLCTHLGLDGRVVELRWLGEESEQLR